MPCLILQKIMKYDRYRSLSLPKGGLKSEDVERFSNLPKYIPFFYPLSLTCQKSFHPVHVRKRCNSAIMKCSYEIELLRLTFLFKML